MTPDEELKQRIKELEAENRELKAEIQAAHSVLDGARVAMPPDMDQLTDPEKGRALGIVGRITQAMIAWNACPFKVSQGQQV